MKFFEKLYVGFQTARYSQTENQRMLGFITGIDNTKAYQKRKETVDKWRDKTIEPRIIENKPVLGFKILEVVSRYSTDNKVFRVYDPRGFELEISSSNLLDIVLKHIIAQGNIMEPMLWFGKTLVSGNSKEYQNFIDPKKLLAGPVKAGDFFNHPGNDQVVYRFEGRFHVVTIDMKQEAFDYEHQNKNYNSWDRRRPSNPKFAKNENRVLIQYRFNNQRKEAFDVYTRFSLKDGEVSSYNVHIRSSKFKDLEYIGDSYDNEQINKFVLPTGSNLAKMFEQYPAKHHGYSLLSFTSNSISPGVNQFAVLFEKRDEAKAFNVDMDWCNNNFAWNKNKYSYWANDDDEFSKDYYKFSFEFYNNEKLEKEID